MKKFRITFTTDCLQSYRDFDRQVGCLLSFQLSQDHYIYNGDSWDLYSSIDSFEFDNIDVRDNTFDTLFPKLDKDIDQMFVLI